MLKAAMVGQIASGPGMQTSYVLVFGISALVCFFGARRTKYIDHNETRWGIRWLLLASGAWATAHVGYLLAPTEGLQYWLFVAGLIAGIAAVGPWLYFCSAYTGRSLHREPMIRRLAIGVFALIVAIKLTNPLHGAYFSTDVVTEPFVYLQITHEPLHWVVMGLAYSLSAIGFFMLFELFYRVNSETAPLFVLVGLTAVPVVFDFIGIVSPLMLDITHSPIGVAAFSVGVLSVYLGRFQIVRLAGESDDPIVIVDADDRIRDFNQRAAQLFASLDGNTGERFSELLPDAAAALDSGESLFTKAVDGVTRYYAVSASSFSTDRAQTGRTIIFTDITHREQYQQKLEQQNNQLEQFASIVSHDLRNPLSVAQGWTELAIEENDTSQLSNVVDAHERMNEIIEEILTLAREGTSIDELEDLDLETVARQSWEMITAEDSTLVVDGSHDVPIEADPERLQQLFENLFRNAIEHGGSDVTVTVGSLADNAGFYIADDGVGIPESDREAIFSAGFTTAEKGTGFGLAIVKEIVDAHGWSIRATDGRDGGARFEIEISEPRPSDAEPDRDATMQPEKDPAEGRRGESLP